MERAFPVSRPVLVACAALLLPGIAAAESFDYTVEQFNLLQAIGLVIAFGLGFMSGRQR